MGIIIIDELIDRSNEARKEKTLMYIGRSSDNRRRIGRGTLQGSEHG